MTNRRASSPRKAAKLAESAPPATETAARISTEDLRRHDRMLKLVAEAERLQAKINQLGDRQTELLAAFKIWSEELHERYSLATDGSEGIAPNGTIIRRH